jgi:signal peptidase I
VTSIADYPLTERQARSHRLATKLLLPLIVLLASILLPLYVVFDTSKVDGPSMIPTLQDREYLLITRGWATPARGDVVVVTFRDPADGTVGEIVKRVVALGGDKVSVRGDVAFVNGAKETFNHQVMEAQTRFPVFDSVVPSGTVFLMGDNRPISDDSRHLGPLPVADVHGKVVAVWGPIDRVRLIPSP